MIGFNTRNNISKLIPDHPAHMTISDLVDSLFDADDDPETDGYVVLIEEGDTDRVLDEISDDWRLVDIPWEGITRMGNFFWTIYFANNEYGLVFVIPDEPWVNGALREVIELNLDP